MGELQRERLGFGLSFVLLCDIAVGKQHSLWSSKIASLLKIDYYIEHLLVEWQTTLFVVSLWNKSHIGEPIL